MLLAGFFVLGFAAALLLISCASGPSRADHYREYNAALQKAHATATLVAGSEEAAQALAAWKQALADLTFPDDSDAPKLDEVYADKLYFNDTLKTLHSGGEVRDYLHETAGLLTSGSVECLATMRDDKGDYYLRWQMSYAGPKMNGGEPIVTIGMTQLRFNQAGRVILHQDYWDPSAGIFEHIPVVGGQVKFLRGRM